MSHVQRRTRNRAVVGEHPHLGVTEPLHDRRYPQVDRVALGEVEHLASDDLSESSNVGGEVRGLVAVALVGVHLHESDLSFALVTCGASVASVCEPPSAATESLFWFVHGCSPDTPRGG